MSLYDRHISDSPSIFATGEKLSGGRKRWEKTIRDFLAKAKEEGRYEVGSKRGWDFLPDRPCVSDVVVRYFGSQGHLTKWDSVLAYFGYEWEDFSQCLT